MRCLALPLNSVGLLNCFPHASPSEEGSAIPILRAFMSVRAREALGQALRWRLGEVFQERRKQLW